MTGIVEFLTARLDEDEAETLSSNPDGEAESWEVEQAPGISDIDVYTVDGRPICDRAQMAAAHIARHDPARVLAEVKAKRALIEDWRTYAERHRRDDCDPEAGAAWAALSYILVSFAGVHRSHPDYAGDDIGDWTWPDDDPAWRADA